MMTGTNSHQVSSPYQVKFLAIGAVINKIRVIQGWNMVSPKDAEPTAKAWIEQLDRYGVKPEEYDNLLRLAIDRRVVMLQHGKTPDPLTVELLLAEYLNHRQRGKLK